MTRIGAKVLAGLRAMSYPGASLLFLLLLAADLAFILLHVHNKLGTNPFAYFDIEQDGGYAELYGYIKYLWAIILCACLRVRTGSHGYIAWVLVFTYFLFDDALQLHENFGDLVARSIDFRPPFNLAADDLGEIAVSALVGVFLLAVLALAWLRGSPTFRNASTDLAIMVVALAFFGIIADVVHAAISFGGAVSAALGLIEDAGELVVGSVILWYLFSLAMRNGELDPYLHQLPFGATAGESPPG